MRPLLLAFLLAALSVGFAQTCQTELQADLTPEELAAPASGLQAARLLQRGVNLLEPASPPLRGHRLPVPVEPGETGFGTMIYLDQRDLLPPGLDASAPIPLEHWREMLARLLDWYGLRLEPSGDLTLAGLIADLDRAIRLAAPRITPVAVVATDPEARDRVAFWGLVMNGSVRQRLVVKRPPPEDFALTGGPAGALPYLSNCAHQVRSYVYAPLETAKRLFLANSSDTSMGVAAVVPEDRGGHRMVPQGEEGAYLSFEAEALAPVEMYAAVFYGGRVGPNALLRLVTQVRTNMNPVQLVQLLLAN